MRQGQFESIRKARPKAGAITRCVCLSILFITGISFVVASTTTQIELIANPPEKTSGPFSQQINQKRAELWEAEWQTAEGEDESNYNKYINATKKIAQLEVELKELEEKRAKAMSSKSGACFPADMLVLTENGAKPIADIKVGDKVLSFDDAGRQVAADVLNAHEFKNNHYFLINDNIEVTALHSFFTNNGWKKARDLQVGDRIQMSTGVFEEIVSVKWFAENQDVYNLTISKNHNFFISPDGKRGYLVHNTGVGGGGGGGGVGAGAGAGHEFIFKE